VGATVISGVNSPPVPEPAEHVLDLVALFVEHRIMVLNLSRFRWYLRVI
jgi:hypothetical protein